MPENIDTELIIDHFFCYNNVVVFPASMSSHLTSFTAHLGKFPLFVAESIDNTAVVAEVVPQKDQVLSRSNPNAIQDVNAIAIIDTQLLQLLYLEATKTYVDSKARLLMAIFRLISTSLTVKIPINDINFNQKAAFYVKNGFKTPVYDSDTNSVALTSFHHETAAATLNMVNKIASEFRNNRGTATVLLPKLVAETIAKTVLHNNETSGKFDITAVTTNGELVLGLNSDNMTEGDDRSVGFISSTFCFHSHPDKITREYQAFISWPSGQDLSTTATTLATDTPILGHFVASPEGVWVIKPTYELQLIMSKLVAAKNQQCIDQVVNKIYSVYSTFDYARHSGSNIPLKRYFAEQAYLEFVADVKLLDIALELPCQSFFDDLRLPLFSVVFIKWKEIDASNQTAIVFEYLPSLFRV